MTDGTTSSFDRVIESFPPMFEVLEATEGNVVAIRVETCTADGFRKLYEILAEKTREYGQVHLYEEAPNWTVSKYLANLSGILPDLEYGSEFHVGRYAAVGDSIWAKVLFHQWRVVAPFWPVAPDEMRYYPLTEREEALDWVTHGGP